MCVAWTFCTDFYLGTVCKDQPIRNCWYCVNPTRGGGLLEWIILSLKSVPTFFPQWQSSLPCCWSQILNLACSRFLLAPGQEGTSQGSGGVRRQECLFEADIMVSLLLEERAVACRRGIVLSVFSLWSHCASFYYFFANVPWTSILIYIFFCVTIRPCLWRGSSGQRVWGKNGRKEEKKETLPRHVVSLFLIKSWHKVRKNSCSEG